MKRFVFPKTIFYPIAGLFLLLALSGIWLTWQAQTENYKLGLAVNQILRIVMRAREMRLSPHTDSLKAQNALIQKLSHEDGMQSRTISAADGARGSILGAINPWGDDIKINLYPKERLVRLVTEVSSHRCRRILDFYAGNPASLELMRVDAMPDMSYNLWRLVYDGQVKGAKNMDVEKINVNCGQSDQAAISLVFRLP